jgi:hypothetical protein
MTWSFSALLVITAVAIMASQTSEPGCLPGTWMQSNTLCLCQVQWKPANSKAAWRYSALLMAEQLCIPCTNHLYHKGVDAGSVEQECTHLSQVQEGVNLVFPIWYCYMQPYLGIYLYIPPCKTGHDPEKISKKQAVHVYIVHTLCFYVQTTCFLNKLNIFSGLWPVVQGAMYQYTPKYGCIRWNHTIL